MLAETRDSALGTGYATATDWVACRSLHRRYGTTYYFSTRLFPRALRNRVHAIYAFVRLPDEAIDNPGELTSDESRVWIADWRSQFESGVAGSRPIHPAMRAFCDTVREAGIPIEEPLAFLDAMEADLTVTRYETYEGLRRYMRGSAAAVGIMMCHAVDAQIDDELMESATRLAEAMQMTNFLRDVGEDARRGRIYLPAEDMAQFGVTEESVLAGEVSPAFERLMQFEIARTRSLYAASDSGIARLPKGAQPAVGLARRLYAQILDKIEQRRYDVFSGRARTTTAEKIATATRILVGRSSVSA